jgi:DNA-binding SARP family transcriptional activator
VTTIEGWAMARFRETANVGGRRPPGDREPRLRVFLLGGFVFWVDGDALLGLSAGSQRLLAFLALCDRTQTRLQVAGTLWPESSGEQAGASLRSAVSRLPGPARQALSVTTRDLGLAQGVVVDVHRSQSLAHRLLDRGSPPAKEDIGRDAVAALSDDLLPGWYDDWVVLAAEDWRQLRVQALEAVAAGLTAVGRLAEAGVAALAAVRAEPLREAARAALIRVHLAEGNPAGAIGELERYRVLLQAELGLEPTSRLRRLLEDD